MKDKPDDFNNNADVDQNTPGVKNNYKDSHGGGHKEMISISQGFMSNDIKILWLRNTLGFIKNDKQSSFKYPEIHMADANFIKSITNQNHESELGSESEALYMAIWEAMTIFQNQYDFLLETVAKNELTIQLMLNKVPKNNSYTLADKPFTKPLTSTKRLKKMDKIIKQKTDIINAVPMHFAIESFQKMLSFLEDSSTFSITFKDLSSNEWQFMTNIKAILKQRQILKNHLSSELDKLLERIGQIYDNYGLIMTINKAKRGEGDTICIQKVPKCKAYLVSEKLSSSAPGQRGSLECLSSEASLRHSGAEMNKTSNIDQGLKATAVQLQTNKQAVYADDNNSIVGVNPKNGDKDMNQDWIKIFQTLSGSHAIYNSLPPRAQSVQSHLMQSTTKSASSQHGSTDTSNNSSIDRRSKVNAIQFQPGGMLDFPDDDTSNVGTEPIGRKGRCRERGMNRMESKIYKALSVPLSSKKALRMMNLMGWNGGALGTRGDGITEPIMPALGVASGAGLGHVRASNSISRKNRSRSSVEPTKSAKPATTTLKLKGYTNKDTSATRLHILRNMIEFISSDEDKKLLSFDRQLVLSETNFLKHTVKNLNKRKRALSLSSKLEKDALIRIHEIMVDKPDVFLEVNVSTSKREIEMLKAFIENPKKKNYKCDQHFPPDDSEVVRKTLSVAKYRITMAPREAYGVYTNKPYQRLAARLMVLEEILKFVESDVTKVNYYIDGSVHRKHMTFMANFVHSMNIRYKEKYMTVKEDTIVDQIFSKLGDYQFECIRYDKIVTLRKKIIMPTISAENDSKKELLSTKSSAEIEFEEVLKCEQNSQVNEEVSTTFDTKEKQNSQILTSDFSIKTDSGEIKCLTKDVLQEQNMEINEEQSYMSINNLSEMKLIEVLKERNTQMNMIVSTIEDLTEIETAEVLEEEQKPHVNQEVGTTSDFAQGENKEVLREEQNTQINVEKSIIKQENMPMYKEFSTAIDVLKIKENKEILIETQNTQINVEQSRINDSAKIKINNDIDAQNIAQHTDEGQMQDVIVRSVVNQEKIENKIFVHYGKSGQDLSDKDIAQTKVSNDKKDRDSENLLRDIKELEKSILKEKNEFKAVPFKAKRIRSDSENSEQQIIKRIRMNGLRVHKDIYIRPKNPQEKMTVNLVRTVQSLISNAIDNTDNLPLLKCNGIGEQQLLLYSCYDQKSYEWLKEIVRDQFTVLDGTTVFSFPRHRMLLHLRTYIDDSTPKILNRIKLYNSNLDIDSWTVNSKVISIGITTLEVEIDNESYIYICQCNFSIFIGIDKAQFVIIQD